METVSFAGNKYWIVRHGKSIPNERGLIVSSMENGIRPEYQLTPEGIDRAHMAGELFLKELKEGNIPTESVRVCYSPFSRTVHTAKVIASVLNLPFEGPQFKAMEDLRERYFGPTFELKSHEKKCPEICALHEKDPQEQPEGGESVNDVANRLAAALGIIEHEFKECAVLIVSHGDPLQILQTLIAAAKQHEKSNNENLVSIIQEVKVPSILSQHRKFALETAELRRMI